jgi:hypothetical protein
MISAGRVIEALTPSGQLCWREINEGARRSARGVEGRLPRAGWPIVPGAFRDTLLDIDLRFRLPIYVLENGTAADDEVDRAGQVQDTGRSAGRGVHRDNPRASDPASKRENS